MAESAYCVESGTRGAQRFVRRTMLGTMGAFAYQLADGKSAVEAIGAAWAVNTAMSGASRYITKDAPGDEDKGRFWLAVGAVGSAAMLL